jgi:SsrA-binding protein
MSKILNRKASFEYHFIKEFIAGLQLSSSEVKSLRNGNCSIGEGYCYIWDDEIFLKNIFISKYYESTYNNHQERRDRKLLLHKKEIIEIARLSRENGITVIPVEIFLSKGRFKVKIAVAKGKKLYDKREDLKLKDTKREIERFYK